MAPAKETPPRTWGRPGGGQTDHNSERNTPTDVGKTRTSGTASYPEQKHPHGRGEDSSLDWNDLHVEETPPRTWGRPDVEALVGMMGGNTPTDVGKTPTAKGVANDREKHPHGRGEDSNVRLNRHTDEETPPRTWGRRHSAWPGVRCRGNTPTDVGKTTPPEPLCMPTGKHPHGRGEDSL